jgi:hypothetical protein
MIGSIILTWYYLLAGHKPSETIPLPQAASELAVARIDLRKEIKSQALFFYSLEASQRKPLGKILEGRAWGKITGQMQ